MVVGGNNNNSSTNNNGSIVSTDVSMVSMVSMGSIGASRVVVSTGSIGINHSKVWKHYFDFIVSLKNFVATEFDINQCIHTLFSVLLGHDDAKYPIILHILISTNIIISTKNELIINFYTQPDDYSTTAVPGIV